MEHRAGWDATFSAPKSVSLTALVGGDERVKEAHRESGQVALDELERFLQARIGRNHRVRIGLSPSATRPRDRAREKRTARENTRSVPLPVELMQINCRTSPFSLQSWAFKGNLVRGRDRSAYRFANWMTMGFLRLTFEVEDV
jgi:hypothetical protein